MTTECLSPPDSSFHGLPGWRRAALAALRIEVRYGVVAETIRLETCIVTCNHVSLLDGIAVALASPRPLAFAVNRHHAVANPWTSALLRWMERRDLGTVVPVDAASPLGARHLLRSLRAGLSVCIFPEGGLARPGQPRPAQPGADWLHRASSCPLVDARIEGAENSRLFALEGRAWRPSIILHL